MRALRSITVFVISIILHVTPSRKYSKREAEYSPIIPYPGTNIIVIEHFVGYEVLFLYNTSEDTHGFIPETRKFVCEPEAWVF